MFILQFIRSIGRNRQVIFELTKREFQSSYIQNLLGLTWAVVEPLVMMLIFWVVFGLGMRSGLELDIPFVVYLITGLVLFLFFNETVIQSAALMKQYSFLVKRVNFDLSLLPLIKILSKSILHLLVIAAMVPILLLNGIIPSLFWIQIIYYLFAASMLMLGVSWMISSIYLFIPDIQNLVKIIMRVLMYLTPIFWVLEIFPAKYHWIFKLNPLYYLVTGYRDSLVYGRWFFADPPQLLYFWAFTLVMLLIGGMTYRLLKPHFADVI